MSKRRCGLCGLDPAAGFASINGVFYCHGDEDEESTCYMQAMANAATNVWNHVLFSNQATPSEVPDT
jgi:hypothetical protein